MEQTAGGKSKLRMKSSCRRQLLRNLTRGLEASRTAPPSRAVGAAMIAVGAGVSERAQVTTRALQRERCKLRCAPVCAKQVMQLQWYHVQVRRLRQEGSHEDLCRVQYGSSPDATSVEQLRSHMRQKHLTCGRSTRKRMWWRLGDGSMFAVSCVPALFFLV